MVLILRSLLLSYYYDYYAKYRGTLFLTVPHLVFGSKKLFQTGQSHYTVEISSNVTSQ